MAQSQVISIGSFKDILSRIVSIDSQIVTIVCQADLLETGKAAKALARVVLDGVKARDLKCGATQSTAGFTGAVPNVYYMLELVSLLQEESILPADCSGIVDHPLEVGAVAVFRITGLKPWKELMQIPPIQLLW